MFEVGNSVFITNAVHDLMTVKSIDDETNLLECEVLINGVKFTAYLPPEMLAIEDGEPPVMGFQTNGVNDYDADDD